jgi:CRP-like cAMP-binding protein
MASDPRVLRDRITRLPLFDGVSDELLTRHVLVGEELRLTAGETLVEQGVRSLGFDILLDGAVEFAREVGGRRVHVLTFEPTSCWGHEPLMADVPVPVSGLALADSWIYRLPPDRFWDMVSACPGILRGLVRTVAERFQIMGESTEQQMRLVSLGTMTAGLAHELNNPASAARAAAADLGAATLRQARASVRLAGLDLSAATRAGLAELADAAWPPTGRSSTRSPAPTGPTS